MNKEPSTNSGTVLGGVVFLGVQVAVVGVAVAVTAIKLNRDEHECQPLPPSRLKPLAVEPLYDRPDFVSDGQLLAVLHKLRPRLAGPEPKINHVDHALRLWGAEAEFSDPECLWGVQMRDLLLNHERFAEAWGKDTEPLLIENGGRWGFRTQEGPATASHVDHTLAGLAEVGTPLDFPVVLPDGRTTVAALVEGSIQSFDLQQVEYEWSSLAYVLYLKSFSGYRDVNGQEITFDRLADRMMRERLKLGVCYGNHRIHTLTVFLRIDDVHPILSPECRRRVIAHLKHTTEVLVASQDPAGFWNQYWATATPPVADDALEQDVVDAPGRRILATGHALEWWALAPREVLPPDDVIQRAAEWAAAEVIAMDDETVRADYTFLSHVGRALALWRGHFPSHFIQDMEEAFPCGS